MKDLAALSGELVRERTEERRDISRYIHDSISQHLVALSFTLSALPAVNADLPHLVELCCRDVRVISCIMTPPPHGEGNLFANIETYAGWLGRETGSPINVSGGGRLPPTTPDTEHLILAAVQEWMIQTILKRVKASSFITLSGEGSGILLELKSVPDPDTDGATEMKAITNGWTAIRARVNACGGRFEITADSTGASVRMSLPGTCRG